MLRGAQSFILFPIHHTSFLTTHFLEQPNISILLYILSLKMNNHSKQKAKGKHTKISCFKSTQAMLT